MIREGIIETVEAMRRRVDMRSPASAEAEALRRQIWEWTHSRDAALDAALCAEAGMEPNPLASLRMRQGNALWLARLAAEAEEKREIEARRAGAAREARA